MRSVFVLVLLGISAASALEANPIRKIVTLMQDMQKEIEAEGEKEKVLYDNFMCWCETGAADLKKVSCFLSLSSEISPVVQVGA